MRWDMAEREDGMAEWQEADFCHRPTPEDIEEVMARGAEITEEETTMFAEALGYDAAEFARRIDAAKEARLAADPTLQLMEVVREQHLAKADVTDAAALRVPSTFFSFTELCRRGEAVEKGVVLRHGGKLWRTVQTHTPMETFPPGMETASLYTRIDKQHAGTAEDPIPYEQGMAFEEGKYYEQFGVVYVCIMTTQTGYPNDLRDLGSIVQEVGID